MKFLDVVLLGTSISTQVLLLAAVANSSQHKSRATLTTRKKSQFVYHKFNNSADILVRQEAALILEQDRRQWMDSEHVEDVIYVAEQDEDGSVKYIWSGELDWLPQDVVPSWEQFYDTFIHVSASAFDEDLEHNLRMITLDRDYPLKALRGRQGVVATRQINAFTIIGVYSGILLRWGSESSPSKDMRAELDWLKMFDSRSSAADIYHYGIGIPLITSSDPIEQNEGDDSDDVIGPFEKDHVMISALNRGNVLSLINSYWTPPTGKPSTTIEDLLNVDIAIIRMNNNAPLPVYYAVRDIEPGEVLLTDRGPENPRRSSRETQEKNHVAQGVLWSDRLLRFVYHREGDNDDDGEKLWFLELKPSQDMDSSIKELELLGATVVCTYRRTLLVKIPGGNQRTGGKMCPKPKPLSVLASKLKEQIKCCEWKQRQNAQGKYPIGPERITYRGYRFVTKRERMQK